MATNVISGHDSYILFTTYGFPFELTEELAKERNLTINRAEFDKEMKQHQEASRAGAEQKFKGGLADNSEKVIQYHTATHLLLAGLRKTLGEHVHQAGSNITNERLRFDFTHDKKVEAVHLKEIENYVNNAIKNNATVSVEILDKNVAQDDSSIEGSFWEKYPEKVKVYTIKDDSGIVYSKELCGGPHVDATNHIQGTFKIVKEESSAHGVRRIKAVIE
jgi:alanyl-tRNA synthetase